MYHVHFFLNRYQSVRLVMLKILKLMGFCRFRAACIDDFLEALIVLHRQFEWSFPAASNGSRVSSKICTLISFSYTSFLVGGASKR